MSTYGYDRRKALRAINLGLTLQKTDRILTGNRKITVRVVGTTEATFSYANAVQLGVEKLDLGNTEDLLAVMGLNYHELAHILYTPRLSANELTWAKSRTEEVNIKAAFNFLEEARIETLFGAQYVKAKHFFTVMVAKLLLGKYQRPTDVMNATDASQLGYTPEEAHAIYTHLLVYGRKYLPADLRDSVRDYSLAKLGGRPDEVRKLTEAEAIVDEYRLLPLHQVRTRGRELAILLTVLYPDFFEFLEYITASGQHSPITNGASQGDIRENASPAQQVEVCEKAMQDEADGYEEVDLNNEDDESDTGNGKGLKDSEDNDDDLNAGSGVSDDVSGDLDEEDDDTENSKPDPSGDAESEQDYKPVSGQGGGEDDDADEENSASDAAGTSTDASPDESVPDYSDIKDLARKFTEIIVNDNRVQRDLAEVMDALDEDREVSTGQYISERRPVTSEEREVAQRLGREFEKLAQDVAPSWNYGSDYGRLNVYRAMDTDADPDTIFDEWEEGRESDASAEVVILVDLSGSMTGNRIAGASSFCWTVAAALAEVDAKVTVYGFSNSGRVYTLRGRDDAHTDTVPIFKVIAGTSPAFALNAAKVLLNGSDIQNRVLIVMTDGHWGANDYENLGSWGPIANVASTYEPILSEVRAHKTLIGIDIHEDAEYFKDLATIFDVSAVCTSVTDLTEPVLRTIEGVVRQNVFHGN